MDDLDHSLHIAEFDWTSFYDESEECGLLQPALACPDILSDSEDSLNTGLQEQETHRSAEVDSDATEDNSAGCSTGENDCTASLMTLNESGAEGERVAGVTEVDCPAGNVLGTKDVHLKTVDVTEKTNNTLETGASGVECSGAPTTLKKEDEIVQTEIVNNAQNDGVSSVPDRAEKERWFVTVNYSPARPRQRAPTVKKKRRQKKTCKISHACCYRQEKPLEEEDAAGGGDTECFIESNQDLIPSSGGNRSAETKPESDPHVSQMSREEDSASENSFHSSKENLSEVTMDRNKPKPGRSTGSTGKVNPLQVESAESDDFSSESYLPAAESAEETLLKPVDSIRLQSLVSLPSETSDVDNALDGQMDSFRSSLSCSVAAANRDSHECTVDAHRATIFQANETPDDNSTCGINTRSTELHMLSDKPGDQKHQMNPTASGSSSGNQLSPVPDLTVTPCSVVDSPEMYTEAAGRARPVFAISAFWDEMEKLTINDILQLRRSRSTTPKETEATVTEHVDETSRSSPFDPAHVELSDTADSDYFTQPDESKPDRSSCEFSTSDFEDEYWQFIGTSRNPSPDLPGKSQERTRDSSLLYQEEEESTSSDGKETPVPLGDFAGQCFADQDSHSLSKLTLPRQMTKSKSMHNVQALDLTSPSGSRCQSVDETMVLKDSNSLEPFPPALFISSYDADVLDDHFPEVSEYFFTEDKENNDSGCITVYNPDELSVAPVFDFSLCPLRDDAPFSSLHDCLGSDDKPIPIFSCCPPTVREITFPKLDYVFLRTEDKVDNFSPIRVVSCSFMQAGRCGTRAAAAGGSRSWNRLLQMRKTGFRDRGGSIWSRTSGTWMCPLDNENTEGQDPLIAVLTEGKVFASPRVFREPAVQSSILETKEAAIREGIFSTLKQSDMCLVCIAFASWVLRSSDPENADAWKAALLANVSALSAIQYLRQYVRKKTPRQDAA